LIVGFVCAHDLGFRGYLSLVAVDTAARHQGTARALERAVESAPTDQGCKVLISTHGGMRWGSTAAWDDSRQK
jgi:hypothetical protein